MLSDRDYMREPEPHRPTATTVLIWVLGICFVIQSLLQVYGGVDFPSLLGLSRAGMASGKIWQLVTFQFLHSAPWPFHVLFNCIGLYFFGRTVESVVGTKRFVWLYLMGGIFGGLLQLLINYFTRVPATQSVIGASAGVCTMLAFFCLKFPHREACFVFYFFPVRLRAIVLFWIVGALSLWGTIFPMGEYAHAAHLGGLLVGLSYLKGTEEGGWIERIGAWQSRRASQWVRPKPSPAPWAKPETRRQPAAPVEVTPAEFMAREVDPILEKIAAHGIHSLTVREKEILERARSKMTKR